MEQSQETIDPGPRWVQSVIMPTDQPSPAAQLARFIELYGESATVESVIKREAQP